MSWQSADRTILGNIVYALGITPIVYMVCIVIITLNGILDDALSEFLLTRPWWVLLIVTYFLSIGFSLFGPIIRRYWKREKALNYMILYYTETLKKEKNTLPSTKDIQDLREYSLLDRLKVWKWHHPDMWSSKYPNEKYSETLFGLVDNFIEYFNSIIEENRKLNTN